MGEFILISNMIYIFLLHLPQVYTHKDILIILLCLFFQIVGYTKDTVEKTNIIITITLSIKILSNLYKRLNTF